LLSGKIFRLLASPGMTGFLSVHGLRVGGFAANQPSEAEREPKGIFLTKRHCY